jgi:sulfur carrier protein
MPISLNGLPLQTACATLQALLQQQGYDLQAAFACAINQRFIPRPQWPSQTLQAGDAIDVITPVTGG